MYKILIIEDDHSIAKLIKLNLEMYGFITRTAYDGSQALEFVEKEIPDLIILDIMLPIQNGYDLLPIFSKKSIPVIMLTAKNSLESKMKGFSLGADDYLTKPFEAVELIARINAVLRRSNKLEEEDIFKFDNITVNIKNRKVLKQSDSIEMTMKEFELLIYLVKNQGIALSRELLLDKVWSFDYLGSTRTVDVHIQKLRSKLDTTRISTVYKYGYRFDG